MTISTVKKQLYRKSNTLSYGWLLSKFDGHVLACMMKPRKGGSTVFVYKDILGKLKKAGYSTYRIREDELFSQSTVYALRNGKPVNIKTLDTVCQLLNCPIEEIVEIKREEM